MRAQMHDILGLAQGIDDEKEMIAKIGYHQIVNDPAGFRCEYGIALASRGEPENIGGDQPFQRLCRVFDPARSRPKHRLAHVGDVEQAGRGARVLVLLQDAGGVLHGHAVAGERHQFRAMRDMQIVQRKAGERPGRGNSFNHRTNSAHNEECEPDCMSLGSD
jgi:hypothetical protein